MSDNRDIQNDPEQPDFLKGYQDAEQQAKAASKEYVADPETGEAVEATKEEQKKEEQKKEEKPEKTPKEKSEKSTKILLKNQAMQKFINDSKDIVNITSRVDEIEGQRLLFNALNKAEQALVDSNITWVEIRQSAMVSAMVSKVLLGLDAEQDEIYLIPRKKVKTDKKYFMNVDISYKGYRKLVMQHSINKEIDPVVWADAFLIREGDEFEKIITSNGGDFVFKPKPLNDDEVIGSFAYVKFQSGRMVLKDFTRKDLEKYKEASERQMYGKTSPAWKYWENEMFLAKTMKATCKTIPLDLKEKKLKDSYSNALVEDAEYEVVNDSERIKLTPGGVE